MPEENKPYKVLATKYRPQNFDDLIGQDVLVRTITNAINNNRIANAFLLTGIRGVGKTTTARIIAKALNCIGEDGKGNATPSPCGVCSSCTSITQDRNPDVLEMDAASRTGVDDIRDIIDSVNYLPGSVRYKIYIIDEVHMLSKNAFNALLKTLEEPPSHVKFIFATTEIRKIPITILSRCQRFDLRRVGHDVLVKHLDKISKNEGAEVDEEALGLIANASEGSVRDSLSLLDQAIAHNEGKVSGKDVLDMLGLADTGRIIELFESIAKGDIQQALVIFNQLYDDGADITLILNDLLEFVYLLTKLKVTPDLQIAGTLPENQYKMAKEISGNLSLSYITRFWQILLKGIGEVKQSSNYLMAGEMIIVRIGYMSDLPSPASIIADIKSGKIEGVMSKPANSGFEDTEPKKKLLSKVDNFNELVELFKQKSEVLLYSWLMSDVHLVNFEQEKLEIRVSGAIPSDFASRISKKLSEWTGSNWIVAISKEKGQPTIAQQRESAEDAVINEASKDEDVSRILNAFPGASVANVKEIKKA